MARHRRQSQRSPAPGTIGILFRTLAAPTRKRPASTARHVLESSSSQLQARLGLKTYGTLGNVNGTRVTNQRVAFGSVDVGYLTI